MKNQTEGEDIYDFCLVMHFVLAWVRDGSGKPRARNERGLVAYSPVSDCCQSCWAEACTGMPQKMHSESMNIVCHNVWRIATEIN
jgi:hypothetical protein